MNLTETIISAHIIYQTLVLEFYYYEDHRSCNGYYYMAVGLGCPALSALVQIRLKFNRSMVYYSQLYGK